MPDTPHHHVVIVGAGFAGLGMAIRLRQQATTDFVVLERADEVGGTWRDNSYPGCACDVPAHLYSFSFELNPSWSRSFSAQPEIWEYLRHCADRYGLRPHIRFGHEMLAAWWDPARLCWRIRTNHGDLTADVLVLATGALSEPAIPRIPGIESFRGTVFHSARWRHDHDLRGRRVAVVGTGASAIQFVPRIQPEVAALTVFQRTPPWILPRADRASSAPLRTLYRVVPGLQRLVRSGLYWRRELAVPGFTAFPRLLKAAERVARAHLCRQVPDPRLRAGLTPDYAIGCKRILLSNDYLPALAESNVELVRSGLAEIGPDWVQATNGARRTVDTIIFGTGFRVTEMPVAPRLRGRDGRTLAEVWSTGATAHRGTTILGFPNLFMLVGPNTGLGHTSMIYMIESQLNYVLDALRYLRRTGGRGAVEVRAQAQATYNEALQARMARTVWNSGGCSSWYLDRQGRNTTLWPTFTWRFRRATRHFRPDEYLLHQPSPASWSAAPSPAAPSDQGAAIRPG